MTDIELSPEKMAESLKLVGEFLILILVILIYATYLAISHPETWIWLVFLFVAVILSIVILTQQYMSVIFERNLIERIERIDVETLAKIEENIREKLLTGESDDEALRDFELELEKAERKARSKKRSK
jgi:hypothetical protein